jgi:hypothetical protein
MAGTIQGEMELLRKEQAMSKKAVEGYKNQMARQLRNEMGKDIKKTVGGSGDAQPRKSGSFIMRMIDRFLSKI